jgi:hypothetical protein
MALRENTTGQKNTAIGTEALKSNVRASDNVALGYRALFTNSDGSSNTALGTKALYSNVSGGQNVAIGTEALYNNLASDNVAIGFQALKVNTTGRENIALGSNSLKLNTEGVWNIGIGQLSLKQNSVGNQNIAIGYNSLPNVSNGALNVGIGISCGPYLASGVGNSFFGHSTGPQKNANNTGNFNTYIGTQAGFGNSSDWENTTCIGYNSFATGPNQVVLGATDVTTVKTYGAMEATAFNIVSDKRDKSDIQPTIYGLDFIKQLNPVDFKYDYRDNYKTERPDKNNYETQELYDIAINNWIEENTIDKLLERKDGSKKNNNFNHGFIAQDIESLGYISAINKNTYEDKYTMAYTELIAPLVKAVQELSRQNENLAGQNAELMRRVEVLENRI